ncbi:MAG: efflux RND transporter periplasmic adaptor subunit, partial [Caulobacteraceae bacterium]|nr:efflux RND transporter periplasmic adaptor subunit [Caulobacteraceae bacterium]
MTRSPLLTARTSAVFLALALSAFGLSACGKGSAGKAKIEGAAAAPADMRSVRVIKVESRELTGGLVASGVLVSREEAAVGSELAGFRVARVLVEEGAVVAAGQPLVQLDDTLIQAQIAQQTALVAQQAVAARQSQLQADRVVGLQGQGVVSEEQLQQRQFQAESSHAALAAQTAILQDFKTRQARMTIRAPVGGRVLERTVRPGDISGGGTYFRIARDNLVELDAEVPERSLSTVQVGDGAEVTLPSGKTVQGKVRLISPRIDAQSRLGRIRVLLPVSNDLRPGGYAQAAFNSATRKATVVPEAAIRFDAEGASVMVVGEGN